MAAPNRVLGLNLGTQTVGMAEFRTGSDGGLVLSNYKLTELLADPAADASRLSQVRMAISEMSDSLRVKGSEVNYAISAQSVFTRFVKLPAVDEDKVDQIIGFEAQQNVPFPINEVVWTYQLVGSGEGGRIEVVLVAIKSDLLDDINDAVQGTGLRTGIVDVAPMALYNAFRYNYSDVTDCSLLVDIGARTTNLIFIEPRKVFSRSIPIGGTTITTNIAKDIAEPFGAAEERKRKGGFVSLGGSYADPDDPQLARVSKVVRNTMTRLHGEISRSVSFYRAQQQGTAPARIFLCGASSGLPYMREFFQEKLQLPVEFFNPLRNVSVASSLNLDEISKQAHVLGELVGLGLRSMSECPIELNLQPESVIQAKRLSRRQPFLILTGICLLLCLAGWWLYFLRAAQVEAAVLDKLNPQVTTLKSFETKFAAVNKEIKSAQEVAAPFIQAVEDREYWAKIVDDLNARLPEQFIWITVMEPQYFLPDGKAENVPLGTEARGSANPPAGAAMGLRIKGLYLDNPKAANVIDEYVRNLSESPYFDINLAKKNEINPVRSTPTATEWAFEYELRLKLKKPIVQ